MTDKKIGQSVFNNIIPALGRLARRGLLLAGLLTAGGPVWGQQPIAEGTYSIQFNSNTSHYLNVSGNNYQNGKPYLNTKTSKDYWYLEKCSDGSYYYIIHVSDGRYVISHNDGNSNQEKSVHLESGPQLDDNAKFKITATGNRYNITPKSGNGNFSFNAWGGAGGDIGYYTATDGGSKWSFVTESSIIQCVFLYEGNYCDGTAAGTTTFNPSTCLWMGSNNGTFTNGSVFLNRGNNKNDKFSFVNSGGSNCTLGTQSDGKTLKVGTHDNGKFRYSNGWGTSNTDQRVVYTYTRESYEVSQTRPTVSGPIEITALGTSAGTFTHTDAVYQPSCVDYIFYNSTHHFCVGNTYKGSTRPSESISRYEWSLGNISSEYAEIGTSTGVINYKKTVTEDITARVTVTAVTESGKKLESDVYYVTFKPTKKFYIEITASSEDVSKGSVDTNPENLPTELYGQTAGATSASISVTFTATAKEGYAFVKWVDAGGTQISTDNPLVETFTSSSENFNAPATYTRTAVFEELPKFYYQIDWEGINTNWADGSSQSEISGSVSVESTTIMVHGAALGATSATVTTNDISLTATANEGFSFKNWTDASGTVVSTNPVYTPNNFTVTSQDDSNPTVIKFTATFDEFPILYAKLSLNVYEYLAETHTYSAVNKGSTASWDVTLQNGYLAFHATSADQTSVTQTIKLTANAGNGFGLRGWSTQYVEPANIATGPYASNATIYSMQVTAKYKTRAEADAAPINIGVYFEEYPIFYFYPQTEVIEMTDGATDPGSASVDPDGIQEFYAKSITATEGTASVTFKATAKTGYKFGGWYTINGTDTTLISTYNPYTARLKSTSKDKDNPAVTKYYAQFLTSMLSIQAEDIELDAESDGWLDITVTPADAWKSYIIKSLTPSLVYVDNSGHCRSNATPGSTTITIQGVTTSGETPAELYTEVTAKVRVKCKMPVISFSPSNDGSQAMLTLTRGTDDAVAQDAGVSRQTTLFYTTDDVEGSSTVTWHKYDGTVGVDPDATVYAKSVMLQSDGSTLDTDYTESNIAKAKYVKPQVAKPSVIIDNDGVTFTSDTPGPVTYYYQVNDAMAGTDPTTTSYTGTWTTGSSKITGIASEKYIRVIATKAGYENSDVTEKQNIFASGVSGSTVILNDYEDHNWTYYQPKGNLPDKYPVSQMSSPYPKDVKITYLGGGVDGASSVGLSGLNDTEKSINTFIYYKTIEKKAWGDTEGQILKGDYAYKVIPNPFSKRPKKNSTYYGFGGWKLVSGGEYINNHSNNDVLRLEELITFASTMPEYGAEIVFTATWVEATVVTNTTSGLSQNGTYETNFIVYTDNNSHSLSALGNAATVSSYYPDGTPSGGSARISGVSAPSKDTKIEFIGIGNAAASTSASGTFTASGNALLFVGRGCTGYVQYLYGSGGKMRARIESGYYDYCHPMQGGAASTNSNFAQIVFGNDYERATNDGLTSNDQYEDNSERRKMRVKVFVGSNNAGSHATDNTDEFLDINIKSGYYGYSADYSKISSTSNKDGWGLGIGGNTDNASNYTAPDIDGTSRSFTNTQLRSNVPEKTMSFYVGRTRGGGKGGVNRLLVEGGELCSINGGGYQNASVIGYHLRIKGGWVKGAVYGTASSSDTKANLKLVITGGEVNGWVAGGCNGTDQQSGNAGCNNGNTYIYVGGTTNLQSHRQNADGTPIYNNAWGYIGSVEGGAIYGSGRGMEGSGSYDHMGSTIESYTVVADEAYVERNVCAGGYYGIAQQGNIFITGGTIGGSVYGGAWGPVSNTTDWCGKNTLISMSGGTVKGGIYGGNYGGKNASASIQENAVIRIMGGQVGTPTAPANIHGGGYGNSTGIKGNVDLSIGTRNETTGATSGSAVIYGDVYGGSALGTVNDATSDHTYVTLNAGTIYGSLYGGGLGNASTQADVNGSVAVKVYGGSVKKTDEDGANGSGGVYGANNINGAPKSTVTVDIYKTDAHNNGMDGEAGTDDDEYAIYSVFGGGNQAAYTNNAGYPKVTVHDCENSIYRVYGGGNQAKVSSTDVTINGGNIIGRVFGGCRGSKDSKADVDGNVSLKIYGGRILKAFGGNDSGGEVKGNIGIQVSQAGYTASTCPIVMDYLYGGGNNADSKTATMDIRYAKKIDYVFGGACAANMTGNVNLNIVAGKIGTVFGGNDQMGDIKNGNISVTVNWWDETHDNVSYSFENNSLGSVYGGGNIADFEGSTTVKVLNAHLTGNVFGGGKKADIGDSTCVVIGDWTDAHNVVIDGDVYGGGDQAAVRNSTRVTVNDCGTIIGGDVYGGGNAAPVGVDNGNSAKTTVTVWGGTMNRIFGGGHGYPTADPPIGADVYGSTNVKFFGGTVNGIFGGSNSVGNITQGSHVFLDMALCPDADDSGNQAVEECEMNLQEAYGAGNEAYMAGTSTLEIGCIDDMGEIYGGSRKADINNNIVLTISSGTFRRVFGGNNEGGCIKGSITVNVEETGCHPVVIDELYGCGNQASYSIYGYDDDGKPVASGDAKYGNPKINIISCTSIGSVYGGGLGEGAVVYGTPNVHIDMVQGRHYNRISNEWGNKLGTISTVFGGGNAAKVVGDTNVEIGTNGNGVNISDNIYGGGNQAEVTGSTSVTIGR